MLSAVPERLMRDDIVCHDMTSVAPRCGAPGISKKAGSLLNLET